MIQTSKKRLAPLLLAGFLLAGGCGHHHDEDDPGVPSGATCPTPQSLTYENFGRAFMATYCLRCHSAGVTGAARNGAPSDHNFDLLLDIRSLAEHIDQLAGAGPARLNTQMPPDGTRPGEAERRRLGEWLACGAP